MNPSKRRRAALASAVILVATGLGAQVSPTRAEVTPDPAALVRRVAAAQEAAGVASADVDLRLRIHKSATQPPDCVFTGTLRVEQGHQALTVAGRSAGVTCAVANRYVVGRLFDGQEPLESVLARFAFSVLGVKLVDDDHYYLLQGTAWDPKGNPHGITAWIDDDRAVVPEGTLNYAWGEIDTQQTYTRMNNAWILTEQFLSAPKFDASLQIEYHNFRFRHGRREFGPAALGLLHRFAAPGGSGDPVKRATSPGDGAPRRSCGPDHAGAVQAHAASRTVR